MLTSIPKEVWAFDCEWVPDIQAGRLLYSLPDELPQTEVLRIMWEHGGATPDNPQPFLRTLLCRVVSIAVVIRRVNAAGHSSLQLMALPEDPGNPAMLDEAYLLARFLRDGVSNKQPRLVGYNSRNADLRILTQRAIVNGLSIPNFYQRLTAKPWESSDLDLMEVISGYGKIHSATLNEITTLSGIPGKLETSGDDVCGMWYRGEIRAIVEYNVFDALSTYLLWLRLAFFAGSFSPQAYRHEQGLVVKMLRHKIENQGSAYLQKYLAAWQRLHTGTGQDAGIFT